MNNAPEQTISRSDDRSRKTASGRRPQLYLVLRCDDLCAPAARVSLGSLTEANLGRGPELAIERGDGILSVSVPDRRMSKHHARLVEDLGRWRLEDRGSKNGTFVNGARVDRVDLRDGDLIEIGHTFLLYRISDDAGDVILDEDTRAEPATTTLNPPWARQLDDLRAIAPTDNTVLLRGATGTGKELVARAIHRLSGRRGPFVAVNCGGLAPTLIEAQLFGHVRGAYSGATEDGLGLVRSADGGTLFLDEIGDLPLTAQTVLLRVLQEREVLPVGATSPSPVEFRLVAATHRDLEAMQAAGTFREDLFARINGYTAQLPSLHERREDIGLLVGAILGADAAPVRLTFAAARALLTYPWPRNIRELETMLCAAVALAGRDQVQLAHLPPHLEPAVGTASGGRDEESDDELRARLIALLRRHDGNVAAVARALGKARAQIHRYAHRLGIDFDDFRDGSP